MFDSEDGRSGLRLLLARALLDRPVRVLDVFVFSRLRAESILTASCPLRPNEARPLLRISASQMTICRQARWSHPIYLERISRCYRASRDGIANFLDGR